MLNLLINLKKCRNPENASAGNLLVLSAFLSGAVLFWLFGKELFDSGLIEFSLRNFSIAFSAAMLFVMLSAFSQLGPVQVAVIDAFFEFAVCCFALSELSGELSINSVLFLLIKIFALILTAMLLSKRADVSSIRLLGLLRSDKKRISDLVLNTAILIIIILILLIICLKSF